MLVEPYVPKKKETNPLFFESKWGDWNIFKRTTLFYVFVCAIFFSSCFFLLIRSTKNLFLSSFLKSFKRAISPRPPPPLPSLKKWLIQWLRVPLTAITPMQSLFFTGTLRAEGAHAWRHTRRKQNARKNKPLNFPKWHRFLSENRTHSKRRCSLQSNRAVFFTVLQKGASSMIVQRRNSF